MNLLQWFFFSFQKHHWSWWRLAFGPTAVGQNLCRTRTVDTAGQAHEDVKMGGPETDGLQQRSNPGQQQLKSFFKKQQKSKTRVHSYTCHSTIEWNGRSTAVARVSSEIRRYTYSHPMFTYYIVTPWHSYNRDTGTELSFHIYGLV